MSSTSRVNFASVISATQSAISKQSLPLPWDVVEVKGTLEELVAAVKAKGIPTFEWHDSDDRSGDVMGVDAWWISGEMAVSVGGRTIIGRRDLVWDEIWRACK